jgi:hypothetical protein
VIVLGVILLIVGYWLLPELLPECPPPLDHVAVFLGWLFLLIGVVLLILSIVGRPVGGRRYWY